MNRPLSGTLMDPLIHLSAAESGVPLNRWSQAVDATLARSQKTRRNRLR